jgi:hypothetical protein
MRSKNMPSSTSLLLNGAAILVVVASVGVVLRSTLLGEEIPSCTERYVNGTRFSLEHNGALISAAVLQGQASNTDWGLEGGARAVKLKSGPAKQALELNLAAAPSVARDNASGRAGMGFHWTPASLGNTQAGCLSYAVFVPEGFTFGRGGRLPGLLGEATREPHDAAPAFSTRYTWNEKGALDLYPQLPGLAEGRPLGPVSGSFALKPGTWTALDQEIVLNAPGQANGLLRVWQDGALVFEKKNVVFRIKPSVELTGVLVEAAAGEVAAGTKQGAQKIWLSPFELRWK